MPRRLYAAALLAFCLVWVPGCLSFPAVPPRGEPSAGQPVRIAGASGPLSRRDSAAILEKLKKQSGAAELLERHVVLEEAIAGSPLVAGNQVTLLQDGPATYRSMFEAIRGARDHINLETYIFEDDEIGRRFADALLEKQSKGVQVNLIYDSVGSIKTPRAFFERLQKAGVRVLEFAPVNPLALRKGYALNHRDHRKQLIVDGRVAFIGGINISSVYSSSPSSGKAAGEGKDAPWRDTHVRVEGPVVGEFQKLFLETWSKQKGDALPERRYFPEAKRAGNHVVRAIGSAADDEFSPIYVTLVSAINHAENTIDITVAYFIPDVQLMSAITEAAQRGVRVRMILPSQSDFWAVFHAGRSRYRELLRAGVRVYERKEALLHSKTVLIDDVWATIGSTNFDPRSFLHNDEINAVVLGYDFAREMNAMFQKDLEQSQQVTMESWSRRSLRTRVMEWAARLWEYWL